MAEKCPVCGKKISSFGGLFSEVPPREDALTRGKALGLYQSGMCASCLDIAFEAVEKKNRKLEDEIKKKEKEEKETQKAIGLSTDLLKKIFLSPSSLPADVQDLGLVTGYCIMGTGPISTIASSLTDAFGMKSNAYLEKVKLAETDALNMLKVEALKMRADAVYNVRVNLAEATSGHGMIMVSVSGAAVNSGKADNDIEEAWRMVAEGK